MKDNQVIIDHLFRHQFGKMVSILCRIFGLAHLETIEDAVQDTFIKATLAWRNGLPENPEAWLTTAAKNRTIDLFRKLKSEKERTQYMDAGTSSIAINELFLDEEIADSQLRMIFTACHPALDPRDQIAFALKTISGFSQKEIAAALLMKEESVRKRLQRARLAIKEKNIRFEIPQGPELPQRMGRVLEVLYLLFNEGFHSNKQEKLIREDLCSEAARLTRMLIDNKSTAQPNVHALFAIMCFHSARLDSKVNDKNEIIDLRTQDRSLWYKPLIDLGNRSMHRAVEYGEPSEYHYEAAIAFEHVKAATFEDTDWQRILMWYERLQTIAPSPFNLLNMSVVHMELEDLENAQSTIDGVQAEQLGQRSYLYYGCMAELCKRQGNLQQAHAHYDTALATVSNGSEKAYLLKKKRQLSE